MSQPQQQQRSAAAGAGGHQRQRQQQQQQQQQQHKPGTAAAAATPPRHHHPPATAAAAAPGGADTAAVAAAAAAGTAGPGGAPGGSTSTSSSSGWGLSHLYDLIGKIGEGTYGLVYLATCKDNPKRLVAIKTFKTGREGEGVSPTAVREIMLLRELSHEHIVKLSGVHVCRREPSLSLAFDYAEHDLYEIIWHHRDRLAGPIHPYVVKSLVWQLLNGVTYLHQNWVIHRDLKPSNVLVMGDGPEAGRVKVADFGLARFFQSPLRPLSDNGVVVTIWYRPPELLLGARHYTRAVDVWGAGCILAELLTLRPLFQGQERKQAGSPFQADQCDRIFRVLGRPQASAWPLLEALPHWAGNAEGVADPRPEWGANRLEAHLCDVLRQLQDAFNKAGSSGGSSSSHHQQQRQQRPGSSLPVNVPMPTPACIDLLQRMLAYDPAARITAEEALNHPWFKEGPLPGPNAFFTDGRLLVSYPRRHKQAAAAAHAGGGSTAPPTLQQHQAASQQQAGGGGKRLGGSSGSQKGAKQQQQQQGARRGLTGSKLAPSGAAAGAAGSKRKLEGGSQQQQQRGGSGGAGSSKQQQQRR